jgi:hypothetical protein
LFWSFLNPPLALSTMVEHLHGASDRDLRFFN